MLRRVSTISHMNQSGYRLPPASLERRVAVFASYCRRTSLLALLLAAVGAATAVTVVCVLVYWNGWVVTTAIVPVALLGLRWFRDGTVRGAAARLERGFPQLQGRLIAALEVARITDGEREGYSAELVQAAVEQVDAVAAALPLAGAVPRRRLAVGALVALVGLGLWLIASGLFPARFRLGWTNAFASRLVQVGFSVLPGDTTVLPNSDVTIECRVHPALFRAVTLEMAGDRRERRVLRLVDGRGSLTRSVGAGFAYRFRVLGRASEQHRVLLREPLTLERLVFVSHYPAYTGLDSVRWTGTEAAVLRGTRVSFDGVAGQVLTRGSFIMSGETSGVRIHPGDERRFSGWFHVRSDGEGRLELSGSGSTEPVASVRLRAVADEPPFVKVFAPGRDIDLPMDMRVTLGVNCIDDFGLSDLFLVSGRESLDTRQRLKRLAGRREDTTLYVLDLSRSALLPGDELRYCIVAVDNDVVSGPKETRSEVYTIRFPTMTEIYDAAVDQTRRTTDQLGMMPAQQSAISAELARVGDELKRNRDLTWDERRKLEQVLQQQEQLLQRIDELSQDVAKTASELAQGMAYDPETMERLGQLQDLLAQLLPRDLQQALAQMRERLQQNSPGIQRALEQLQESQAEMKQGIERALELLRRLMQEQRLEALARRAEELQAAQERLADALARESTAALGRRQQNITGGIDSLRQEMERLAADIAQNDSGRPGSEKAVADSLAAVANWLDQRQASQQSERLAQQLQSGSTRDAESQSRGLVEQFRHLAERLNALSRQFQDRRAQQAARRLTAGARDLLMLSEQQEEMEHTATAAADPSLLARRQMGLAEGARMAAETLAALGTQTMAIPPELGPALARAMAAMTRAASGLALNRSGAARAEMVDARHELDGAAALLLEAAGSVQQGGKGGGLEGLLQQLRQMAEQQMSINAGMAGIPIPIPMPGGLTPGQLQQLQQLAAQQQALREQLRQMLQSMGGERPGLTASLQQLLDEMRRVERDMTELNVDRQLVERQDRMLSRLLDAERSVRQQGFREERRSESGRAYAVGNHPGMPVDRGERNRLLREELMRALRRGYPADYEAMIRAYFGRLLNEP